MQTMSASTQSARCLPPTYSTPRYWPVITVVMIALALAHVILWISLWRMTRVGYGDFSAFYCAGKIVQQGQGHDLYSLERQASTRKQYFPEVQIVGAGLPFFHPAYESLIYAALARLPYAQAYLVWNLAGFLMLLITVARLGKHLIPPLNSMRFLLPAALGYFPIAEIFLHGQDDLLLLLLFAMAYVSLTKGRERSAGLLLALGLFKFHLVLPVVAVLLFQRRGRIAQGFFAGAAMMFLLSIATAGVLGTQQYLRLLFHLDNMPENAISAFTFQMPNLRGALITVFSSWAPRPAIKIAILLLSAGLVVYAGLAVRRLKGDVKLSYSLAIVTAILVSYHANMYDLSLLVFPLLFLSERLLLPGGPPARVQWLLVFLLAFSPVYHVLLSRLQTHLLFWPILAFLVVSIRQSKLDWKHELQPIEELKPV